VERQNHTTSPGRTPGTLQSPPAHPPLLHYIGRGLPPHFPNAMHGYQAKSWQHAPRLILVVVDQPNPHTGQLNLLPEHFFLVTGWTEEEKDVVAVLGHYRRRGTFEDRSIGFNVTVHPRLSSPWFSADVTTLWRSCPSIGRLDEDCLGAVVSWVGEDRQRGTKQANEHLPGRLRCTKMSRRVSATGRTRSQGDWQAAIRAGAWPLNVGGVLPHRLGV
jgi:hypothetical protein